MMEWVKQYQAVVYWVSGAGLVLLVVSLVVTPAVVVRIPADYFARAERPPKGESERGRVARVLGTVGKNVAGYVLIVAGLAMVVLPGQGLLTMLIGFLLIDFPGKYRAERWVVGRPWVLGPINWLRVRRGRAPLRVRG